MKKKRKVVALLLVAALVFGFWQGPIKSKADKDNNKKIAQEVEKENETTNEEDAEEKIIIPEGEILESFTIDGTDNDYFEYKMTETEIYCIYYEYVGEDEVGNKQYNEKITKAPILTELELNNQEDTNDNGKLITRNGEVATGTGDGPLYWQKITMEKLKQDYYYQSGVRGEDIYYRIGGQQSFAVNYSKLNDDAAADIDDFIYQIDLVNRELNECLIAAIGAVMLAISAIIASYISVGAAKCLRIIVPLLQKFGVTLLSITPIGFGKLVFKTYDDYKELDRIFVRAAVHGSIFTP